MDWFDVLLDFGPSQEKTMNAKHKESLALNESKKVCPVPSTLPWATFSAHMRLGAVGQPRPRSVGPIASLRLWRLLGPCPVPVVLAAAGGCGEFLSQVTWPKPPNPFSWHPPLPVWPPPTPLSSLPIGWIGQKRVQELLLTTQMVFPQS